MTRPFTPRAYQGPAMAFLDETKRANLWMRMGLGKTPTCLTLLDAYYNVAGESDPTLVLAPKRVAQTTWPDEVAKWDHLKDLSVVPVIGTQEQRLAALSTPSQIYSMNYDNLPWLRDHYADNGKAWPFKRVIADESTRLKNFRTKQGGVRAQALADVAHRDVTEWWNLTGTPAPNGLKDLWGQQWFIDQGQRLGVSYTAFEQRWFGYRRVQDAISRKAHILPVIFPGSDVEIRARLTDCTLSIDPKDYFDLREPLVTNIEVDLPASTRKAYNKMEREFFAEMGGFEFEALNSAVKSQKLLQFASGALYLDPERYGRDGADLKWIEVHDAKIEALDSIIEEAAGESILVAYQFKSDLARLLRAFPQGRELDADPATVAHWNNGQIPLLFAHPASAGHGLNLQDGGRTVVFFSHWWDLEQREQILERIGPMRQLQSGYERSVMLYNIVCRDTMDEVVIERCEGKKTTQQAVFDYMKRKGLR